MFHYNVNGQFVEGFAQMTPPVLDDARFSYSFDIFLYIDDELVDTAKFVNTNLGGGSLIREFSLTQLEEIGRPAYFVVIDNSVYVPGMRPLGLLAWVNRADRPVYLHYSLTNSQNFLHKRRRFDIKVFKSCVFEFDTGYMKNNLLAGAF